MAHGKMTSVIGGRHNIASNFGATVAGGDHNIASGKYSFVAGQYGDTDDKTNSAVLAFTWEHQTRSRCLAEKEYSVTICAKNGVFINGKNIEQQIKSLQTETTVAHNEIALVKTRLNELMEALGAIEHKRDPLTTPKVKPVVIQNCTRKCRHKKGNKLGDGTCQPKFNHCGCEYDRGDCCKKTLKHNNKECKKNPEACCCQDPNHDNYGLRCPTTLPVIRPHYHPDEMNISIHLGTEDFNISLIEEELEVDEEAVAPCVDVVARVLLWGILCTVLFLGTVLLYIINCTTCCRQALRSFLIRIIENQPPFDTNISSQKKTYGRTHEEYHDEVELDEMHSGEDDKDTDDRL